LSKPVLTLSFDSRYPVILGDDCLLEHLDMRQTILHDTFVDMARFEVQNLHRFLKRPRAPNLPSLDRPFPLVKFNMSKYDIKPPSWVKDHFLGLQKDYALGGKVCSPGRSPLTES